MVAASVSMAIASITSWFTPTVLFCAANLIIATIFIVSKNNHHNHHQPPDSLSRVSSFLHRARSFNSSFYSATTTAAESVSPPKYSSLSPLAQSIHSSSNEELPAPSEPPEIIQPLSLLQRVNSSLKFSSDSPRQLGLDRPPSFVDRVKSFRMFDWGATPTQPETVETTDRSHNPPEHHVTRSKSDNNPSTKKKKKSSLVVEMKKSRSEMRMAPSDDDEDDEVDLRRPATARDHVADEEVDARADDFINRFKQQLKLQRLESLKRYKEMLNRRG